MHTWDTQRGETLEDRCNARVFRTRMYYVKHKYQYRSDDGASDQCDEFVDALGCNQEELSREEAYAPQVTCPRETECDRRGKEPDGARSGEMEVASLEASQQAARRSWEGRRTPTEALDSASGWCLRWRQDAEAMPIVQERTDGMDVDIVPLRTLARRILALDILF